MPCCAMPEHSGVRQIGQEVDNDVSPVLSCVETDSAWCTDERSSLSRCVAVARSYFELSHRRSNHYNYTRSLLEKNFGVRCPEIN